MLPHCFDHLHHDTPTCRNPECCSAVITFSLLLGCSGRDPMQVSPQRLSRQAEQKYRQSIQFLRANRPVEALRSLEAASDDLATLASRAGGRTASTVYTTIAKSCETISAIAWPQHRILSYKCQRLAWRARLASIASLSAEDAAFVTVLQSGDVGVPYLMPEEVPAKTRRRPDLPMQPSERLLLVAGGLLAMYLLYRCTLAFYFSPFVQ